MSIFWEEDDPSSFSTQIRAETGKRYFLRVERLPDKGWDWLVWPAGGPRSGVRYGCASSMKAAKAAAEATLTTLCPGVYVCISEPLPTVICHSHDGQPTAHRPSL